MKVFKLTKELLKSDPWKMIIGVLTDFGFYFTPVFISLISKKVFDYLAGTVDLQINVWLLILLFIPLVMLFQTACDFIFLYTGMAFLFLGQILVRVNLLTGIFKQLGASSLPDSTGEAISRFQGDAREINSFLYNILERFAITFATIIAYGIMIVNNAKVTLFLSIPFGGMFFLVFLTRKMVGRYRKERRIAAGAVAGNIGEMFKSVQSSKVNTAEEGVLSHFDKLNEKRGKAATKDDVLQTSINFIFRLVFATSTGIILLVATQNIQDNTFTIGDFILFLTLMDSIGRFIFYMGDLVPAYQRTSISYQRLHRLIEGTEGPKVSEFDIVKKQELYLKKNFPEIPEFVYNDEQRLQTLSCDNLSYTYPNSSIGISDISFQINPKSLTVITGRIGSGKTTLLRSLIGLLPQHSGKVKWNNELISNPQEFFTPPRLAYTAQIPYLFSDSIKENILQGLNEDNVDLNEALYLAVIDDEVKKFDKGIDTLIGPKGVNLSGGQKHRVSAARMLARNPEVIVFDDLSSALDVETEYKLWNRLFEYPDKTYLVVSHRPTVLQKADHIILMKDGKIHAQGKLDDLLESNEEMQVLYQKQFNGK